MDNELASTDRHPTRNPVFSDAQRFEAWIAATRVPTIQGHSSACAIRVEPVDSDEPVYEVAFGKSQLHSSDFRGLLAALRGVVEAVPPDSFAVVYTQSQPLIDGLRNKSGRSANFDLYKRLDDLCLKKRIVLDLKFVGGAKRSPFPELKTMAQNAARFDQESAA